MTTNYSRAIMLFNEDIRAIAVSYEPAPEGKKPSVTLYKTLDKNIKEGDLVAVPTDTRHFATCCRVEEVDCEVDFQSGAKLEWIISKVDTAANDETLKLEQKWIEQMKKAEKRAERERIKKNMMEMYEEEGVDIKGLANFKPSNAIENKKDK